MGRGAWGVFVEGTATAANRFLCEALSLTCGGTKEHEKIKEAARNHQETVMVVAVVVVVVVVVLVVVQQAAVASSSRGSVQTNYTERILLG
ncbi:hypothetical protein E2C01_046127 [Portunus trituberculatus]|uniref:Uncharacterized protein n=1 Tax=Portunus trituberculatus TaxID=210409 RepID=A0A5B7G6S5_PORTR|nr:hypothetical protein [Portunus trituberculatus]